MTISDQVRAIIAAEGNSGATAIARKLGVSRRAVEAAKKLAYATAYFAALRAGLPVEVARERGRLARAQVTLSSLSSPA